MRSGLLNITGIDVEWSASTLLHFFRSSTMTVLHREDPSVEITASVPRGIMRRLWRTGCHYPYKGIKVKQSFADKYKVFCAWVFLPEVCALQRMIDDLKGTPIEERTLKRVLLLPNTITLYRYHVSGIWRQDLSHGGSRAVGIFETQASIACIVWGNAVHFRNILRGWETHLKRSPGADTPFVVNMLEYARAQLHLADELLELMDPALKQPWVSIGKTHRLGWVGIGLLINFDAVAFI
ncbi:hypothetical protein BDM02DRAFT_2328745 [Thelephora ganbajun]|uniref:Uncharacterized protein n=1 Tax=Thelephora ganbajun TaxID=370292 RepID=A0ACB6ZGJ2_THEGA|nr:hypothetical protein BDM02DRAFT_2328745 [Thelephora ganbajun]